MACFTASLGVIFLLGFIKISAAKDACEFYGAVGQQSLTLPFVYEQLANSNLMKWTHNGTIIFYREQGKVSVGKPQDISATGSLFLKNLPFSSAGIYKAEVLYPNGTKTWTGRLCMMEKVSKPQLTYVCDFKSSAVNLNCHIAKPQGLVFSWTLDGKTLTSETRQTLSISLTQLKGERSFMCSVANKASKESSDIVHPTCKSSPPPSPPPLLCFRHQIVVAVLAGGGGLCLLLLIITIVLCCRHRHDKTHTRQRNKGELRMLSINKRDPDSISPEYETMHPTENSPPPSPQPSPRACYQKVSQPEVQSENRLPQISTEAEGHKPSPVPKPRTRNPQTANM